MTQEFDIAKLNPGMAGMVLILGISVLKVAKPQNHQEKRVVFSIWFLLVYGINAYKF